MTDYPVPQPRATVPKVPSSGETDRSRKRNHRPGPWPRSAARVAARRLRHRASLIDRAHPPATPSTTPLSPCQGMKTTAGHRSKFPPETLSSASILTVAGRASRSFVRAAGGSTWNRSSTRATDGQNRGRMIFSQGRARVATTARTHGSGYGTVHSPGGPYRPVEGECLHGGGAASMRRCGWHGYGRANRELGDSRHDARAAIAR